MKNLNAHIAAVAYYHPDTVYTNDFFVEHFKAMNLDSTVEKLNHSLGRNIRYRIDGSEENIITMACESSRAAMKQAGITEDMIDMIVFVTATPEYLSPTNALKLSHALGTKNAHVIYDMNGCCTGMITGIDLVSRYIQSNKSVKRALVVGAIHMTPQASKNELIFYSTFGDGSSAVIIEGKEEEVKKGFIDSAHITNPDYHWTVIMPGCGLSNIHREDIPAEQKMGVSQPYDFDFLKDEWGKIIGRLLTNNDLELKDIDHFLFSQFSLSAINETCEKVGISRDKTTFIGDQFGYMGESSPIFALKAAIDQGKIKEGSNIILASAGSGYNISGVLVRF